MEIMIENLTKIFNRHIEFYRDGPDETHDNDYSSDELACMAEHIQKKISKLKTDLSEEMLIRDPVSTVFIKLRKLSPQKYSKCGGVAFIKIMDEMCKPLPRSIGCRTFPFYPSKFHNFKEANVFHFYAASNQFYKMVLNKPPIRARSINNPSQAIQSIEYIENELSTERYQQCKALLREKSDQCAQEILLFHETDLNNIESIFNNNFNLDSSPLNRPKAMIFGRGIYMSEFPGVSLNYGKGLMLCKVLTGCTETISIHDYSARTAVIPDQFDSREVVKDGVAVMHVIKNSDQILPYCVINLHNQENKECLRQSNLPQLPSNLPLPQFISTYLNFPILRTNFLPVQSNPPPVWTHPFAIPPLYQPATQHNDNTEEYKRKLQELKKYVEPLKKKLENTDSSRYNKLHKLLEIITTPKKKVPLNILIQCEQVLKRCL
eukprot:GFUD01069246.1.p1 GENE.GFUD01069246.1~~GFUD01069246.1.p1  ORF type:complete len:434 (+),score=85.63 GFUD01069246.1:341-1642(+)